MEKVVKKEETQKTYCKDCRQYSKKNLEESKPNCKLHSKFVARKSCCKDFQSV